MRTFLLAILLTTSTLAFSVEKDTQVKIKGTVPSKGEFVVNTQMTAPSKVPAVPLPPSNPATSSVPSAFPLIPTNAAEPTSSAINVVNGTVTPPPVIATMAQAKAAGIDPFGELAPKKEKEADIPPATKHLSWSTLGADLEVFSTKLLKVLKLESAFGTVKPFLLPIFTLFLGGILAWFAVNLRRKFFPSH